ncbi:MAG TPA: hypothetical protein PLI51_06760, partial [bacterium]|nr:hypothetical protein [bacterium]
MKVAIPQWQGRVSPVFDVAGEVLVADSDGGRIRLELGEAAGFERVRRLVEGNVGVLLCCSISRFLEAAVREAGIDLIPHVCGEVEEILAAWTSGRLRPELFLMPG